MPSERRLTGRDACHPGRIVLRAACEALGAKWHP